MPEIREEIIGFLIAFVSGAIVRLCYHCISCFRANFRHHLLLVEIEDMLYWIATAVYLFVQIYYTSDGVLRWFFALGVVIGTVISTLFVRKMKKMSKKRTLGDEYRDFIAGKTDGGYFTGVKSSQKIEVQLRGNTPYFAKGGRK